MEIIDQSLHFAARLERLKGDIRRLSVSKVVPVYIQTLELSVPTPRTSEVQESLDIIRTGHELLNRASSPKYRVEGTHKVLHSTRLEN